MPVHRTLVTVFDQFLAEQNELFWSKIKEETMPELVLFVEKNYIPGFSLKDFELIFSAKRKVSSYSNGKITFGPFHMGTEYAMFKEDPDLWADAADMKSSTGRNVIVADERMKIDFHKYVEFRSWYIAAHELAHVVVDHIQKICTEVSEPIIPNLSKKLGINLEQKYPALLDLVVNQAWWTRMGMRGSDLYSQRLYTLNYNDKAFKHGVFYQHIYRKLRREIVNPKFGIKVSEWKQRGKPNKLR